MWILRALVRITFLLQESKLGPQGTAKGMKMKNAWWIKTHKQLLCEFSMHLSGTHFCSKGPSLGFQGTAKGMKTGHVWGAKKHKLLLYEFWMHLSGSHSCSKDPSWDPKGQQKEWKWKMSDGQKNINDFYAIFARTCQDHTFAARIQIGTPRGSQRDENRKPLFGKQT